MGPGVKMSYSTTKILSVTEKGKTGTAKMTSSMGMSEVGPDHNLLLPTDDSAKSFLLQDKIL